MTFLWWYFLVNCGILIIAAINDLLADKDKSAAEQFSSIGALTLNIVGFVIIHLHKCG